MDTIHGVRSFEGLSKRSRLTRIGSAPVLVAALADIIRSKKAAARSQDLAVLPILEKVLEETTHRQEGEAERAGDRE